jgi:membrane-associated phospholipid phosphatase
LALLAVLSLAELDLRLFPVFNDLSLYTGPAFWANATVLGDGLVCAVLLLVWVKRHPERIWAGLLGALFMVLVLRLFKGMISLPRPLGVLPADVVTVIGPGHRRGAFPSGHSATIALLAGVWALTASRNSVRWVALTVAAVVGISRMAVGVHWPSDVLAGLALGWVSAWLGLRWGKRFSWGAGSPGQDILSGALVIAGIVLLIIDHTGYPGVLWFQRSIALACLAWVALTFLRPSHARNQL